MASSKTILARSAAPVVLLGVGVMLLMGCIYVPSTRQFQTNGNRRPESLIGPFDSIKLGKTSLEDALPAIQRQLDYAPGRPPPPLDFDGHFGVNSDSRSVGVSYTVRTGFLFSICGGESDSAQRRLVLTYDERGIVTDARSYAPSERPPGGVPLNWLPEDTSKMLSADAIRRLRQSGRLASEEQLAARRAELDRVRMWRQQLADTARSRESPAASRSVPATGPTP